MNLSDLAAKGATPAGFVLTLALRTVDDAWLAAFARGLGADAGRFACPLLGGDTVSTPGPLMASITAFGRITPGKMVHRSGAQAGDRVVVTATRAPVAVEESGVATDVFTAKEDPLIGWQAASAAPEQFHFPFVRIQ